MKVALCQYNSTVGDCDANSQRVIDTLRESDADLIVFPELFIQGYPPKDLLENKWFIDLTLKSVEKICKASTAYPGKGIVVGVTIPDNIRNGRGLYNSAVLISDGEIKFHQNKSLLPSYDVFDETRYFDPADSIDIVEFKGVKLGLTVCEDAWNDKTMWTRRKYDFDPVEYLAEKGAEIFINISASPFHSGKENLRYSIVENHSKRHGIPFVFVNSIGANDELVFDGGSLVFNENGELCEQLPRFSEAVSVVDVNNLEKKNRLKFDPIGNIYNALVLGVRDYLSKCGFKKAVIGLSGGIDSAVTCAIATEALGKENVRGITMPSEYSSSGSIDDSLALAENLGIECTVIPIKSIFKEFVTGLAPILSGFKPDLTEENLQARIRGTLLMAVSNKTGALLLTTGNKSEMAVGYCTLYGDMNGGLAVISDVYKTVVYDLARYINRNCEIIPESTITKPPSAELRPDQKDEDSLPPYEVLDKALRLVIEDNSSKNDLISNGIESDIADWILRAVRINEYKRRQAAPGIKITQKAFGFGRRFPIAARYSR